MDPRIIAKAAKAGNVIEMVLAAFRVDRDGPISRQTRVVAFRSVGDCTTLTVRGRVLRMAPTRAGHLDAHHLAPRREHLVSVYRAFDVLEIPDIEVRAETQGVEVIGRTDESGYFSLDVRARPNCSWHGGWHRVEVTCAGAQATADIIVPAATAALAIVSDLDDTAMDTYTTRTLRMLETVLLRSAHRRRAVPGVPSLYRALQGGASTTQNNPVCYISSGAWNLYDFVVDYLDVHELPRGPVFLNDWGSRQRTFHTVAYEHKGPHVASLMQRYPSLPFLLIGDDVHEDPELYAMLAERFPERVAAIWIRMVRNRRNRRAELRALGDRLRAVNTELVVADDSSTFVEAAVRRGWIAPRQVGSVWLAYSSRATGKHEVFIHSFPGGTGDVQISSDGDEDPKWSQGRSNAPMSRLANSSESSASNKKPPSEG